jgi:sialate O-acetylesterase
MVQLLQPLALVAFGSIATASAANTFRISNTLGDGMVLQRAPQSAMVWGFGTAGDKVEITFAGKALAATVDATGTWRQALPPTPASLTPQTLSFTSKGSSGASTTLALKDVLFGDVFLCRSAAASAAARFAAVDATPLRTAAGSRTCSTRRTPWQA